MVCCCKGSTLTLLDSPKFRTSHSFSVIDTYTPGSRHIIYTLNTLRPPRIQPIPPLPTPPIHHRPQPIDAPQRPVRRQTQPRIQHHAVLPGDPALLVEAVLRRELDGPDRLVGRRGFVPDDARVLGRVVRGRGAELDPDVVPSPRVAEVGGEPVGELRRGAGARHGVRAGLLHRGQGGEQGHVAVVVAEAEGRLRVHGVADHVRVGQHPRRVLLDGVAAQLQRRGQSGRAVEVFLPQLHDFEAGVHVRQLDHGRVVEEEVLRREGPVAGRVEPFAAHVEDLEGEAAGPGLRVRLQEHGLVGVAGGDGVGARVREEALGEVRGQGGGDGQGAFDYALGFHVGCAEGVAVLVEVLSVGGCRMVWCVR